jgi:hypothetical protein
MRWIKWTGIATAIVLAVCCFQPWVFIESKNLVITGMDSTGTNFGKPGYLLLILCFLFSVFSLMPFIWAKRANMVVTVLNLAWAIRNYFLFSACSGGECPEKKLGLYVVAIGSVIMLIAALFPDIKVKKASS